MRPTTEEVIARHRAWLAKQGLPIKERPTAPAAAASAAEPAVQPLPAPPAPTPVSRPRQPRPPAPPSPDIRTDDEREWARLCLSRGTPIYDHATRLLRERALT